MYKKTDKDGNITAIAQQNQGKGWSKASDEDIESYKNSIETKDGIKEAYLDAGLTAQAWEIARIQKDLDGDSTEWDNLVSIREKIRKKFK